MKKLIGLFTLIILLSSCGVQTEKKDNLLIQKTFQHEQKEDYDRFFNPEVKKVITIEITEEDWKVLVDEAFDYNENFGTYRSGYTIPATFKYWDSTGYEIEVPQVGVKTKGNMSRNSPNVKVDSSGNPIYNALEPYSYKVKFNETFDLDKENKQYKILNQRQVFAMDEINLKWNVNNEPTYMSELYAFNLLNKAGVLAPRATLATAYIQIGDQLIKQGVVTLFEPVDQEYLEKHLGKENSKGNLYKSLWQQYGPADLKLISNPNAIGIKDWTRNYNPSYDLKTNKKELNHDMLKDFITNINKLQGNAYVDYIDSHFEVDNFIRYLAMSVLLGNPDDFRSNGNNYYLYFDEQMNKVLFLPYDYDHSLGQGWNGAPAFVDYGVEADIINYPRMLTYIFGMNYRSPLVDKILAVPKYKEKYLEYLKEFAAPNGIFTYQDFVDLYEIHVALYSEDTKDGLCRQEFGLRNTEWYFKTKQSSVLKQLMGGIQ